MLGDGSIRFNSVSKEGKPKGNAQYRMVLGAHSLNYLENLYRKVYGNFSSSGLYPYPNVMLPRHHGKIVTQYSFSTRSLPLFTELHNM